ncbi:MAG: putative PEP-binding protein [Ilumatobacteraceae bacterium]
MSETGDAAARITASVRAAEADPSPATIGSALRSVEPDELAEFFHLRLAVADDVAPIGEGLPASPGAASGRIVTSADAALASDGPVILVRPETTPDDVLGMQAARGILTARGGLVSHAAVVARGWGIPAVVGAADLHVDGPTITIGSTVLRAGDHITIDGSTGRVFAGALATSGSTPPPELATLLDWADDVARGHVEVRANADTDGDATHGRRLGARGIGLCRTEHMFLSADRLRIMRRFILSHDPATEAAALAELGAAQTADFETLLEAMDGLPVTVRLLDPPLHEFLPDLVDLTAREARGELTEVEQVEFVAVRRLHETNPMIGTRGVRLGAVRPGVYQMQVRALCTAAANLFERGRRPHVEIMIPLVVDAEELRIARSWVIDVLDEIGHPELSSTVITVGAMIETPRAALVAGDLARHADFFSFGTNDLTQMTYAFSRDDVEARLLPTYRSLGILPDNPFEVLDREGVGELIRIAVERARSTRPDIDLGVCGEHAGHPTSVEFLVGLGIDSVSCSPFRVPMARLGVARALLASGRVAIDQVEFTESDRTVTAPDTTSAESPLVAVDEALVLHVLRIRGFVTPDGFTASLGEHPAELVDRLVDAEYVRHIPARDMYGLLPAGKDRAASLLESTIDDRVRSLLRPHYERFLVLNTEFKQLCTDWQVRNGEPNDHTDADHDRACVTRLSSLYQATVPVLADLGGVLERLRRYRDRLGVAASRVEGGESKQFTGVMCESFHDIWMELHEDLIVVLGIDRVAEGSF